MKSRFKLLFGCLLILFTRLTFSQISTNGIVDINPYTGLQPDLVDGVSALPATGEPLIRHICFIDRHILAITIDERAIIYDNLKPYTKQSGDTLVMSGYHNLSKLLVRKGEPIGYLCGNKNDWLRPFNTISGNSLDVDWASKPSSYSLFSNEDRIPLNPQKVFRKSYPTGRAHVSLECENQIRHEIYLVFKDPLEQSVEYTLKFNNIDIFSKPLHFLWDEQRLRSEAVHINMVGYHPKDMKIGYLSSWLGDGGGHRYPDNLTFQVIDVNTSEVVVSDVVKLKSSKNKSEYEIEGSSYNHNLTDIYTCDFSSLQKTGKYRLVVSGVGCSFNFEISTEIWELTTRLLMKGFFHQRSGIELGPPYTDYQRPRNMHPADGTVIHKCDPSLFHKPVEQGMRIPKATFKRIASSILPDTEVPEAWGGWMDAGDFDRRLEHLFSVRMMMYLYELNSEYFGKLNLNIPESTNKLPDILDEGAWCLDLYRRTQGIYEEGGISWWVESIEHPREGEPSWLNSLPTALIPPTPIPGLLYAATAAQMALIIRNIEPALSQEYLESALAAVKWVDTHPDVQDLDGMDQRIPAEALAYVTLYRLTGDNVWHKRFVRAFKEVFSEGLKNEVSLRNVEILTNYVLIQGMKQDDHLLVQCKRALVHIADDLLDGASQNAFNILKPSDEFMERMVTLHNKVLPVVMAHHITREYKYLDSLVETMQYTMGANPMNRTYISGLGERTFMPYHHDWEADGLHIPAGIPNYGPATQTETKWGWRGVSSIEKIESEGLYPASLCSWPFIEKCFNNIWEAPTNEFTVRNPMGELLLLTGYLAQEREH